MSRSQAAALATTLARGSTTEGGAVEDAGGGAEGRAGGGVGEVGHAPRAAEPNRPIEDADGDFAHPGKLAGAAGKHDPGPGLGEDAGGP